MEILKIWLTQRFKERTTWDGIVIILLSLGVILFKDLIALVAWGTLLYGAWTVVKAEVGKRSEKSKE
jgi:hypothetical protein